MATLEKVAAEAAKLCDDGFGDQFACITMTAFRLSLLHLHLYHHIEHLQSLEQHPELIGVFKEIQENVQRTVDQILTGREDRAAEDPESDPPESFEAFLEGSDTPPAIP